VAQASRVFAIGYKISSNFPNRLYELLNPENKPKIYTLSKDIDLPVSLKGCSTGLVISGVDATKTSNGIDRFISSSSVLVNVLPIGKYLIDSMTVDKNCTITFVGKRISDKKNILGTIDPANKIIIIPLSAAPTSIAALD
jgi:hypothetical protein